MYMCIQRYILLYIHTHTFIYKYIYMYVCMYVCMYVSNKYTLTEGGISNLVRIGSGGFVIERTGRVPFAWPENHISRRHIYRYICLAFLDDLLSSFSSHGHCESSDIRGTFGLKFICNRIKKKAEAESKNCHAKTMLSLKKPIKLIWKTPHMLRLGKSPRSKYEGRS